MLSTLRRTLVSKSWLPDLALIALAWWGAFWLRFNFDVPPEYAQQAWQTMPLALLCMAGALALARVPRQSWRYVTLTDLRQLAAAVALGALLTMALVMGLRFDGFARSVFPISALLTLVLLVGARAAWRTLTERANAHAPDGAAQRPLLIVGTLDDADHSLRTLKGVAGWQVAGIVSPLPQDAGRTLHGVAVLGVPDALADIAAAQRANTVLLASAPGAPLRRELMLRWAGSGLNLLTLPTADELLQPGATTALREVRLEDLLGRAPVQLDAQGLAALLSGQTALVTGAGGSIGAELCRQVARFGVARLVCVDVSEYAIYQLEQELRAAHPQMQCFPLTVVAQAVGRKQ